MYGFLAKSTIAPLNIPSIINKIYESYSQDPKTNSETTMRYFTNSLTKSVVDGFLRNSMNRVIK